jgi:hypothetical protein
MAIPTLREGADLIQNKTDAYIVIPVSDNIDLGLFWMRYGESLDGAIVVQLVKPDGSITELNTAGYYDIVNTMPQKIKIRLTPAEVDQLGTLKVYAIFQMAPLSWVAADRVVLTVIDDPVAG